MIDYFGYAESLKKQADQLLDTTGLISKLSRYGKIEITGSYALNLMVWQDIDIQIELPDSKDKLRIFSDLAYELLHDQNIKDIKLINFTPGKKPTMPIGMYMGISYIAKNIKWKIDIWALNKQDQEKSKIYMTKIKSKLNDANKHLILSWKHKTLLNGRVPQLCSYMLYKAVLMENITDDVKVFDYLTKNGVNLSHLKD